MERNTKSSPVLYTIDAKGKVRTWEQDVIPNEDGTVNLVTRAGLEDGAKTNNVKIIKDSKVKKAFPRACALMDNAVEKKLREKYALSEEEARNSRVVPRPMKAKTYSPDVTLPTRLFVQPKINGVRALYVPSEGKFFSKSGLSFLLPAALMECVKKVSEILGEEIIIDGEIYIPDLPVGSITSAMHTLDNPNRSRMQYHIYDLVTDEPFNVRTKRVYQAFDTYGGEDKILKRVKTQEIHKHEQLPQYYDLFLTQGWEGLMIRTYDGPYGRGQRSAHLWKWKPVFDAEYEVVYITYENRVHDGVQKRLVIFHCHDKKSDTVFKAVPDWSVEERFQWWKDNKDTDLEVLIGNLQPLRVEYRETTVNGTPFHAVAKEFRTPGY